MHADATALACKGEARNPVGPPFRQSQSPKSREADSQGRSYPSQMRCGARTNGERSRAAVDASLRRRLGNKAERDLGSALSRDSLRGGLLRVSGEFEGLLRLAKLCAGVGRGVMAI
jgi:hypothetical protein